MGATYDRAEAIVELLVDAGLVATTDVRSVNPPCVLVTPPTMRPDVCGFQLDWTLVVLAPGPGNADAWLSLDGQVRAVYAVLGEYFTEARSVSYAIPGKSAEPFPAYLVTLTEASA